MIPTEKLKEILEKAGKATKGRRGVEANSERVFVYSGPDEICEGPSRSTLSRMQHYHDLNFIADCDPTTISSIIRELLAWREAEGALRYYADPSKWASLGYVNDFETLKGDDERLREKDHPGRGGDFVAGRRAREALRKIEEARK